MKSEVGPATVPASKRRPQWAALRRMAEVLFSIKPTAPATGGWADT